jgi:hypothetical protein
MSRESRRRAREARQQQRRQADRQAREKALQQEHAVVPAAQVPVEQPSIRSASFQSALQSTFFWGCVALVAAIVFTVLAAMIHDIRWLLVLAWPFAVFAAWEFARTCTKRSDVVRAVTNASAIIAGVGLGWLYFALAPSPTGAAVTRNAFSERQSIILLPPDQGGNDILRLDNVGTLRRHVPFSLDKITLLLNVASLKLPDQRGLNFNIFDMNIYNHKSGKEFLFDRDKNQSHEITVSGRTFTVTLFKVTKLNVPGVAFPVEYSFGISEK